MNSWWKEQHNKRFNNRSALYHLLNVPFDDDHYYFMNDAGGGKYGILQSDEYDSAKYHKVNPYLPEIVAQNSK